MKIKDYIFLANKNLSRRKKGVISNTILIAISVIICLLVISFNICLSNYMNRALVNNIAYRSIVVLGVPEEKQEDIINSIKEIDHISKVIPEKEERTMTTIYSDFFDEYEENMRLSFKGADVNIQPSVIQGRNIENGETNVCLIPNKIYYGEYSQNKEQVYDREAYINGEDFLGKKVFLETHVKVIENWRDKEKYLIELGIDSKDE